MMKRKAAYSTSTGRKKVSPLKEIEGVVSKSELIYYFKEANLSITVGKKSFNVGGRSGIPTIHTGERIVVHLSPNKRVSAIQVLKRNSKKPNVKIRYVFDDYVEFR